MPVIQNRLPEEDRLSHTLRTTGRMIGWTAKTGIKVSLALGAAMAVYMMYSTHKSEEFQKDFATNAETYQQHAAHMLHPEFGLSPGDRENRKMHSDWMETERIQYELRQASRSTAFSMGEKPSLQDMTNAELEAEVAEGKRMQAEEAKRRENPAYLPCMEGQRCDPDRDPNTHVESMEMHRWHTRSDAFMADYSVRAQRTHGDWIEYENGL